MTATTTRLGNRMLQVLLFFSFDNTTGYESSCSRSISPIFSLLVVGGGVEEQNTGERGREREDETQVDLAMILVLLPKGRCGDDDTPN